MTHDSKCEQADGSHGCMCADRLQVSAQHTPGPWEIEKAVNGWARISATNGHWYEFAKVAVMMDRKPSPSGKANARLIAAAPELLEALEGILVITDRDHVAWDKARAAITKAKGGAK